jgi:sporulation protein YlmC with PRC-barrel domain
VNLKDNVKLVSQLIDLPIVDKDDRWCGIVDDVELDGEAGKAMRVHALLVGPGAYSGRMPAWLFAIVRKIAGDRMARVPAGEIVQIGSMVKLACSAEALGLHRTEDKVRSWIPRWGAM